MCSSSTESKDVDKIKITGFTPTIDDKFSFSSHSRAPSNQDLHDRLAAVENRLYDVDRRLLEVEKSIELTHEEKEIILEGIQAIIYEVNKMEKKKE